MGLRIRVSIVENAMQWKRHQVINIPSLQIEKKYLTFTVKTLFHKNCHLWLVLLKWFLWHNVWKLYHIQREINWYDRTTCDISLGTCDRFARCVTYGTGLLKENMVKLNIFQLFPKIIRYPQLWGCLHRLQQIPRTTQ